MAVLAVLFAGIAFCAVFTNLVYWYEALSAHEPDALRAKFRRALLPWALVRIVRTGLTQLAVFCLWPLAPFFHHPPSRAPYRVRGNGLAQGGDGPGPVLLVHGLYHNPSAWFLTIGRLRRAGFAVHTSWYWSFATDFEALRDQLARDVETLHARYGRPVALVGHSLGGLLIRSYMASPASRADDGVCRVATVVTLGAPHQGSKLAALAVGRLGRSLIWRGALVRALEARDRPPCAPALSLYSPIDNMVFPQEGLRIRAPGWQEAETAPLDHVAMLFHTATLRRATRFLAEHAAQGHGATADPAAADETDHEDAQAETTGEPLLHSHD